MSQTELKPTITEETFADVVRRYAGLVYSTAKRRLSNGGLAEDVSQMVFIRLARKPPKVGSHAELAAWLHRTTVHVTVDLWRSETRRRARERQAVVMDSNISETFIWEEICPKLDDALNQLPDNDRHALLLRFFSRKTMREVGLALGVSEDAAKMRVSRAVDRLRTKLGVGVTTGTAALLGDLLLENAAQAAPTPLIAKLTSIKFAAAAGASVGGGFAALHNISKLKFVMGAVALAVTTVGAVLLIRSLTLPASTGPSVAAQVKPQDNQLGFAATKPIESHRQPMDSSSAISPQSGTAMLFTVVDSETGAGLAGAKIHIYMGEIGSKGKSLDLMTVASGVAAITEVPGTHGMNVFVVAEGYVPKVVGWQDGPFTNYTMKLDRALAASGWVVDQQGQPVADATLQMQGPGNKGEMENVDFQTCSATTDENGHWNYNYLPRNVTNRVDFILRKNDFATTDLFVPVAKTGLENVVLVLDSGFTVAGQVSDPQNQPIKNASIKVLSTEPGKSQSINTDENGHFSLTGVAGETEYTHEPPIEINSSGLFVVHGLVGNGPRHVDLATQADGFAPQRVTLPLSDLTNIMNFKLNPAEIFRGHVVDEAGKPIANAVVETDWDNQGVRAFDWETRTDADGRFLWNSAPTGETLFWFQAEGYQWLRDVSLVADATDHEITLTKAVAQ